MNEDRDNPAQNNYDSRALVVVIKNLTEEIRKNIELGLVKGHLEIGDMH